MSVTPATDAEALLDDDRLTLSGLLFESAQGLAARFEHSLRDGTGLSSQWFEILLRLARSPGQRLRMADLAAQTRLTASGLTRAIDRLETQGLVMRAACPSDRRGMFAGLTASGLNRILIAVPAHLDDIDTNLVAPLTERERAQLERILRKVRDHVSPDSASGSEPDC